MATKLDTLLNEITPARTLDAVQRKVDEAVNSFHVPSGYITNHQRFEETMTRLFVHIESAVLMRPRAVHPAMDGSRCREMLTRAYGSEGMYFATQKALCGHDGGLRSVIRDLAGEMASEYAQNEIGARVQAFWNSLTFDEKLAASKEYISKYGHLLPRDVVEDGAARLTVFFPKFLEKHPQLLRQLGRTGR